jgi:hypothetical protein
MLTDEPEFERRSSSFKTEKPFIRQNEMPLLAGVFVLILILFVAVGYMTVCALSGYRSQYVPTMSLSSIRTLGDLTRSC